MKKILILLIFLQHFLAAAQKPNVILILTDDQGYEDLESYGGKGFKTPNINRLAAEGIQFTDYYAPAALCTPSRAGLLTGCYPKRIGMEKFVILTWDKHGINNDEMTLAELFKKADYKTACIGKWHVGHEKPFLPNQQGFDYFSGIPYSNDMGTEWYLPENGPEKYHSAYEKLRPIYQKLAKTPLPVYRNNHIVGHDPEQSALTQNYTQDAIAFIKENKESPFFIYLAHPMPHTPLYASKYFRGKSERGLYGDVIQEIDWSVGEIMKTLKETGLDENTILIFTSDNGPWLLMGDHGGSALPLRDGKATSWEGGMRVPAIIRWPGVAAKGKLCERMVSGMDFLPTFAEILGLDLAGKRKIDGLSFLSLLKNPEGPAVRNELLYFNVNGEAEAIRSGNWKLHIKKFKGWDDAKDGPFKPFLTDLSKDISEGENLALKHPEMVKRLSVRIQEMDSEITRNARPAGRVK